MCVSVANASKKMNGLAGSGDREARAIASRSAQLLPLNSNVGCTALLVLEWRNICLSRGYVAFTPNDRGLGFQQSSGSMPMR